MIPVDGRIAPGLDEFMLRLGQLSTLAHVASFITRRFTRLERDFGEFICRPTFVAEEANAHVAKYLLAKNLCPTAIVATPDSSRARSSYRYPDLELFRNNVTGHPEFRVRNRGDGPVTVWWQDWCLSSPEMESCVGAV